MAFDVTIQSTLGTDSINDRRYKHAIVFRDLYLLNVYSELKSYFFNFLFSCIKIQNARRLQLGTREIWKEEIREINNQP